MTLEKCSEKIRAIDFEWFKLKKKEFNQEAIFDPKKGVYEIQKEIYDDEGNKELWTSTFYYYCFNSSIIDRNPIDFIDTPTYTSPIDLYRLIREILKDLETVTSSIDTVTDKVKYLVAVKECIICQLGENQKGYKSELEYITVHEKFLLLFRKSVLDRFRPIFEAQDLIDWNSSRERCLYFNLNQDRLGALLAILEKAGFFAEKGDGTPSNFSYFLDFANEFFKVTNQKKHQFSKPSKLKDRYRIAKNNPYAPANKYVTKKLLKALQV